MIVKEQKTISFINECECLVDYADLEKAILWYQSKPSCGKKKIYLMGCYPAVSIHNEKLRVHRLLMCFWSNRILSTKEYVNHINENKLDARKSNLEILPAAVHQRITNEGRKQSPSHVAKRIKSMMVTKYGAPIYSSEPIVK